MRTGLALFLMLTLTAPLFAARERTDLARLAPYFCDPKPKSLATKPLADAQVELAFVKAERPLRAVAEDFARDNGHRGFAFGSCVDGRQWVVSTPSPDEMLKVGKDEIKLLFTSRPECRKLEIDGIGEDSAFPREMPKARSLPSRGIKSLAVTCYPKDKPDAGPELWALLNLKSDPVPPITSLDELMAWLAKTRSELRLPPLKAIASLQDLAKSAASNRTLEHPHAFLITNKKAGSWELLGENRAVATDFQALADLLWNSPQHRALLLHAKADAIGYAIQDVSGQKHLVLILARTQAP